LTNCKQARLETQVKIKIKLRLLVMSRNESEKRLDELNRKLGIAQVQKLEDIEEREWLRKKLGYSKSA
jgi:hypothetical protein